ncbi:MAG: hypothetical protein ACTSP8_10270 [Promethearchaeota archaeon]
MPDEFDFHQYKSMDEYSKTMEGSKYLHDLYLKAVNHPVRREILEIVIKDENQLIYNIDYLLKAFCINSIKEGDDGEIFYEITQSGKVVEYFE